MKSTTLDYNKSGEYLLVSNKLLTSLSLPTIKAYMKNGANMTIARWKAISDKTRQSKTVLTDINYHERKTKTSKRDMFLEIQDIENCDIYIYIWKYEI